MRTLGVLVDPGRQAFVGVLLAFTALALGPSDLYAQSPPAGSVVWDTFSGPAVTLPYHTPDLSPGGAAWQLASGSVYPDVHNGIVTSTAAPPGGINVIAGRIDSGLSDAIVRANFTTTGTSGKYGGLVLRGAGPGQFLMLRYSGTTTSAQFELVRANPGYTYTVLQGVSMTPIASGTYAIEARLSGSQIQAVWNGVVKFTATTTDYQTGTLHGTTWYPPTDLTASFDNFEVRPLNAAPIVTDPGYQIQQRGTAVSVPITASDPEGLTLTYSAVGLPPGLTENGATGVISGTPTANGTYTSTISVSDGGVTTVLSVVWTITELPLPPPSSRRVRDTFGGPVVTLPYHTPDVSVGGTGWSYLGGSSDPTVQNGVVTATLVPNGNNFIADGIDGGAANGIVRAQFRTTNASGKYGALVFRAVSGAQWLALRYTGTSTTGRFEIIRRNSDGSYSSLPGVNISPITAGTHAIEARMTGQTITAVLDGTVMFTATVADYVTATRHGLHWYPPTDTTAAFDYFEFFGPDSGPPVVTAPSNRTNAVGTAVSVQIVASDPDNVPLTYSATGLPPGLTVNATTGLITGTISTSANLGVYAVTLKASDGPVVGTKAITWTVTGPPPTVPPSARVFDTFADVSGSLSAHNANVSTTGAKWIQLDGNIAPMVDAGSLVLGPGSTVSGFTVAVIDGGTANGIVATDFRSTSSRAWGGLVLRALDANNLLWLRYYSTWGGGWLELLRSNSTPGVYDVLTKVAVGPIDIGSTHRIEARLLGPSITAFWDGLAVFETTAGDYQSATRFGVVWSPLYDPTTAYDNFKITTETFAPALPAGTLCEAQVQYPILHAESGNTNVSTNVDIPPACQWTVRPYFTDFARPTGYALRTGPGVLQISVDNNLDPPRLGYAIAGGRLVTVSQSSVSGAECGYTVSPPDLDFSYSGDTITVTVTPNYPTCTWTVSSDRNWVLVDGLLRNSAGITGVTVGRNPGVLTRNGTLFVGTRELPVEQQGDLCGFTVSPMAHPPEGRGVPASGTTVYSDVTIAPGCGWEVLSLSSFIQVEAEVNGSPTTNPAGNGRVRIYVQNNPQPFARWGKVQVKKGGYEPKEISVTQEALGGGADPGGPAEFYYLDAIGSVRMITDQSGTVLARHDYLPFGQEFPAASNPNGQRLFFTGKERDPETATGSWSALDYFGARYYQSQTGRFTGVDPTFTWLENVVDPQRWNRYSYVRNNPLRYTDPDGRAIETWWDALNVGIGVASFVSNVKAGNRLGATIDAIGIVLDAGATAVPFVPGGVGTLIKAARGADRAVDAIESTAKVAERVDDVIHVIGRQVDTNVAKGWPGHKVLDAADWSLKKNDDFIKNIIEQRGKVYVGSPRTRKNLWDEVNNRPTVFARELKQFEDAGYKQIGDYLVPPN